MTLPIQAPCSQSSVAPSNATAKQLEASTVLSQLDLIAPILFAKVSAKHRLNDDQKNTCLQVLQAFFQEASPSLPNNLDVNNSAAMLDFVNTYGVAKRYQYSQFNKSPEKNKGQQSSSNLSSSSADDVSADDNGFVDIDLQCTKPKQTQVLDLVVTAHPTQLLDPAFLEGLSKKALELRKNNVNEQGFYGGIAVYLVDNLAPRSKKPTVDDEHQAAMPFVGNAIGAAHKLRKSGKLKSSGSQVDLAFGNWIGGDRDGNPLVTADVLINNVKRNSKQALDFYLKKLGWLDNKRGNKNSIITLLNQEAALRGQLNTIAQKLENTQMHLQEFSHEKQGSIEGEFYPDTNSFVNGLEILKTNIQTSATLSQEDKDKALAKITNLIKGINAKGFYGMSTDLRQNSSMNERFIAALWAKLESKPQGMEGAYADLEEADKTNALTHVLENISVKDLQEAIEKVVAEEETSPEEKDRVLSREWKILQTYKPIQGAFGTDALKHHITANNEQFSDLLEVAVMLKTAGLVEQNAQGGVTVGMDIMPLIETVDDMANASDMLTTALSHEWYKKALQSRSVTGQPIQPIMVGYSDSTKGDGVMSAAWVLQRCKHDLLNVAQEHGVELAFFHGRGGSTARGASGNIEADLATVPPQALSNTHRETIQGEVFADLFLSTQSSQKNLQVLAQGLQAHAAKGEDMSMDPSVNSLLSDLAEESRTKYRDLCSNPGFSNYFQYATPFEAFSLSNAGSRPSKRPAEGEGLDMGKVRAIPYAAAFQQNGTLMPAWYGVGSGLQAVLQCENGSKEINTQQLQQLQQLYQQSPWFKGVVDRIQIAVEQVDLDSALKYAQFGDSKLGLQSQEKPCMQVHKAIAHEFELTQTFLRQIINTLSSLGKTNVDYNSSSSSISSLDSLKSMPIELPQNPQTGVLRLARTLQLQALQSWKEACKDYGPEAQVRKDAEHPMATSMQAIAMLTGAFG